MIAQWLKSLSEYFDTDEKIKKKMQKETIDKANYLLSTAYSSESIHDKMDKIGSLEYKLGNLEQRLKIALVEDVMSTTVEYWQSLIEEISKLGFEIQLAKKQLIYMQEHPE